MINIFKKSFVILLIFSLTVFVFTSCIADNVNEEYDIDSAVDGQRFIIVCKQDLGSNDSIMVIEDLETGYRYIIFIGYRKGGICLMPEDGAIN